MHRKHGESGSGRPQGCAHRGRHGGRRREPIGAAGKGLRDRLRAPGRAPGPGPSRPRSGGWCCRPVRGHPAGRRRGPGEVAAQRRGGRVQGVDEAVGGREQRSGSPPAGSSDCSARSGGSGPGGPSRCSASASWAPAWRTASASLSSWGWTGSGPGCPARRSSAWRCRVGGLEGQPGQRQAVPGRYQRLGERMGHRAAARARRRAGRRTPRRPPRARRAASWQPGRAPALAGRAGVGGQHAGRRSGPGPGTGGRTSRWPWCAPRSATGRRRAGPGRSRPRCRCSRSGAVWLGRQARAAPAARPRSRSGTPRRTGS